VDQPWREVPILDPEEVGPSTGRPLFMVALDAKPLPRVDATNAWL